VVRAPCRWSLKVAIGEQELPIIGGEEFCGFALRLGGEDIMDLPWKVPCISSWIDAKNE
jgi:hypothetical protein